MKKFFTTAWFVGLALLCGIVFGTNISTLSISVINDRDHKITATDAESGIVYLKELEQIINELSYNDEVSVLKIKIANELYELANTSYKTQGIESLYQYLLSILYSDYSNGGSLLSTFKSNITKLTIEFDSIMKVNVEPNETVRIASKTASLEAGEEYEESLNGYIYYAPNNSTKWAVLVHGYMMNGKIMANSLAEMYLDKGYNVLAIDLRGHGKSGGTISMGYLESLDIWDWLTYINNSKNYAIGNRAASQVIVHGISLGGAATLQLWTQKDMGRDLVTQNVIGLIDDSGYYSMTSIIDYMSSTTFGMEMLSIITNINDKAELNKILKETTSEELLTVIMDIGIDKKDFELKQNAFAPNRTVSDVPLYVIHGKEDGVVPYSMSATTVFSKATSSGKLYDFWKVSNMEHAFIVAGLNKVEYEDNLNDFIYYAEKNSINMKVTPENENIIDNLLNFVK